MREWGGSGNSASGQDALPREARGSGRMTPVRSPPGQMTSVPPFSVKELLPAELAQFFRYNGSLTTPPCYQSVLWTVFSQKVQISAKQVSGGGVRRQRHSCNPRLFPTPK